MDNGTKLAGSRPSPIRSPAARHPFWGVLLVAAPRLGLTGLIVGGIATFFVQHPSPPVILGHPPSPFIWSSTPNYSLTPQEAFVQAATLTPCQDEQPAPSRTVTWLATSPHYGVALITGDCGPKAGGAFTWLFTFGRDASQPWLPEAGRIATPGDGFGDGTRVTPPPWLALPADMYSYTAIEPKGLHPRESTAAWYTPERSFVVGQFADLAQRPAAAPPVSLEGYSGWMVAENGLISIVIPRTDGTTFFFAGSGTSAQVEALASQALAHVDELLVPLA